MNKIIIVHYVEDPEAIEAFEKTVYRLWGQHISYTRQAIISILAGLEDIDAIVARLMQNQEDIGAVIAPYYGDAAAAELTRLLKEHIGIAVDIVKAIRDSKSTTELEAAWQTNAEAIAQFLDAADPANWPYDAVLGVLKDHLDCTIKQATARFAKDWTADFATSEQGAVVIMQLAEVMADGIVDSFPEAFVMQTTSRTLKR